MKFSIILLIATLVLLAGCTQQATCNSPYILVGTECCLDANENSICDSDESVETTQKTTNDTQIDNLNKYNNYLTKEFNMYNQIIGEEGISIPSLKSTLTKIGTYYDTVEEFEDYLSTMNNQELVTLTKEYLELSKDSIELNEEYYLFLIDDLKHTSIMNQKDYSIDLLNGIYNCRCDSVDCDFYYQSTLDYYNKSIEAYDDISRTYNLDSYNIMSSSFEKELVVLKDDIPSLVRDSEKYGETNCYKINDEYNDFLGKLDEIEYITDDAYWDEIDSKWIVPINELSFEAEQLYSDIIEVTSEMTS